MSQVGDPNKKITVAPMDEPVPPKVQPVPTPTPEKVPAKDA